MEYLLTTVAIFIVTFVLFPYIAGPIAVYLKQQTPAFPDIFPLTDSEIESCTTPAFMDRSRAMESLGFEQAANVQWVTDSSRSFTRLFYSQSTHECSHVTEITTHVEGQAIAPVRVYYMEFVTEFENGQEIDTNNSSLPGILKRVPQKQTHWLPGVDDAATLYSVHRFLTNNVRESVRPLPTRDRIPEMIQVESARTLKRQVEAGYFYLDEALGTYRPTALGALVMAWKLTWPVGMIRIRMLQSRAARLVRASAHLRT